ncbi:MAG TPA: hypothetical protein VIU36_05325 [Gammaproteobacteria bacterium]
MSVAASCLFLNNPDNAIVGYRVMIHEVIRVTHESMAIHARE